MLDIFDWLRDRVMTWGDRAVEKKLVQVELNSHTWALKKLRPELRRDYARRMWRQLMRDRVYLTRAEILWLAARNRLHSSLRAEKFESTRAQHLAAPPDTARPPEAPAAPVLEGAVTSSGGKPAA